MIQGGEPDARFSKAVLQRADPAGARCRELKVQSTSHSKKVQKLHTACNTYQMSFAPYGVNSG